MKNNDLFEGVSFLDASSGDPFDLEELNEANAAAETDDQDGQNDQNDTNQQDLELDNDDDFENLIEVDETTNEENNTSTQTSEDETDADNDLGSGEDTNSTSNNGSDSPSPLLPYAKLLKDRGILPEFNIEDWDGNEEGLIRGMEDRIQNGINNYKESLNPRVKFLIDNLESGVPFETILKMDKTLTSYADVDDSKLVDDENLSKRILTDYYKKTTKLSDAKINSIIESNETLGTLSDEASQALEELKTLEIEEVKKAQAQALKDKEIAQRRRDDSLRKLGETIQTSTEIIPGIKLDKIEKQNLYDSMVRPVDYAEDGTPLNRAMKLRMEDPYRYEMTLHHLLVLTKDFTDWSRLQLPGRSAALDDLEAVSRNLNTNSSTGNKKPPKKSQDDLLSSIRRNFT